MSSNIDILFIISHKPDNRYKKRLELLNKYYSVAIVYWNKQEKAQFLALSNVQVYEITVPANRTNPLKRLPETAIFINKAYSKVKELNPKCVYVGNLDMLFIAAKYKRKNKAIKIIYEIADLHNLIIDRQKSIFKKIISILLRAEEKRLVQNIDCLVLTSMKFFDIYYKSFIDKNKVVFLPNMPDECSFEGFHKEKHDTFTVGFIGWIRYKEQLHMLIRAAKNACVNVFFAGEDSEGNLFEEECNKYSHVNFYGPFLYEKQIQKLYKKIDCVFAVYDADMANVRVALPNKLYESMLCEMPIIVAENTYLSEIVNELGIGVSVGHKDECKLTELLKKLASDEHFYNNICFACKERKKTVNLTMYNDKFLIAVKRCMNN